MTHSEQTNAVDDYIAKIATRNALATKLEVQGMQVLPELIRVARGDSNQADICRRFLLGLYNGSDFPFDLNTLRRLDDALCDAAMAVLAMDVVSTNAEIHERIPSARNLIRGWAVEAMALKFEIE